MVGSVSIKNFDCQFLVVLRSGTQTGSDRLTITKSNQ